MNPVIRLLLACALIGLPLAATALENRLAGAPSPYLAMHADDPVAWQRWYPGVVAQARREGRLIFISSGYFSCHWCHVMQRESFRDPEIAALLNEHYLPVKLDRELHPDLDALLMDFVEHTRGAGGWPLNVFLTPDGFPLVGVVYLPREHFAGLLRRLVGEWRKDPQGLTELAQGAAARLALPRAEIHGPVRTDDLGERLLAEALGRFDEFDGGFGQGPKFPMVPQWLALLERLAQRPDPDLRQALTLTLDRMAAGGLCDHLESGFFRYATDPGWHTPHFEKMLYDNAQLARLYLLAGAQLGRPDWLEIGRETLTFIETALAAPEGGYWSSFSAQDEQGVEGGVYLWDAERLRAQVPPAERPRLDAWLGLDRPAPFEAGHLPVPQRSVAEQAAIEGVSADEIRRWWANLRARLLAVRSQRTRPLDDKRLAAWNALVLRAQVAAAEVLPGDGGRVWAERARRQGATLLRLFHGPGGWQRTPEGASATLEDLALMAAAQVDLARLAGRRDMLETAHALAAEAWRRFYAHGRWRLGNDHGLPWGGGRAAVADDALPAPPAVLLTVTRRLQQQGLDPAPQGAFREALDSAAPLVAAAPFRHASWVALYTVKAR
ncbi:thioredoxin domain-containing protein [Thiohalobacter sp.]|uniref:thioredoxin domain-containing protein n=1 Tax=Thiohalobacter sp. TaxID=2025948 RepID=UPI002634EB3F|nr:DUF255 domain-containing protein [Thiohalobacter sp.]